MPEYTPEQAKVLLDALLPIMGDELYICLVLNTDGYDEADPQAFIENGDALFKGLLTNIGDQATIQMALLAATTQAIQGSRRIEVGRPGE